MMERLLRNTLTYILQVHKLLREIFAKIKKR